MLIVKCVSWSGLFKNQHLHKRTLKIWLLRWKDGEGKMVDKCMLKIQLCEE